jgi:hypothetical protein
MKELTPIEIIGILIIGQVFMLLMAYHLGYKHGYKHGRQPSGFPKFDPLPPPKRHQGYQPKNDITSKPPKGGSGVPEKFNSNNSNKKK